MTRQRALVVFLLAVSLDVPAAADGQEPPNPGRPQAGAPSEASRPLTQAGFGLTPGIPVGDFSTNVDVAGGVAGHFDVALGRSPVSVGVEAAYLWYGEESRDVPLLGFPDLTVAVTTSNAILLLHGRVRAQKPGGRVRPYADGLMGFINMRTTTSFGADVGCGSTSACTAWGAHSVTDLSDFAWSMGGGAGVMFAFGASPQSMRLDVSLRYLNGGEAEYLTDDFNPLQGGPAPLQSRRSRTDMVLVYIGLAFGR